MKSPDDQKPCWIVTTRSGIKSTYGKNDESRVFVNEDGTAKIYQWLLCETEDTFGNKTTYKYRRDKGEDLRTNRQYHTEERNHEYNQVYLKSIEYVEYIEQDIREEKFLWRINLDYGDFKADALTEKQNGEWETRPDRFSNYKAGFEIRTARRCKRILIKKRLQGVEDRYELLKSYNIEYVQDKYSGISLLKEVILKGHRNDEVESFPPVSFDYTKFEPGHRNYENLAADGDYLPEKSLSDPNFEVIDLFGNGLPCIVNATPTGWRYWRNIGDDRLKFPRTMRNSPLDVLLAEDSVQLADMNGNGSVDLLVTEGGKRGYYSKDDSKGEWASFHHYHQAPSFNLKNPNVKLVDLDGDGVVDVLCTFDHHFLYIRNLNHNSELEFDSPIAIERVHDLDQWPDVFFDSWDQRVRLADMSGDGLQDIVLVHSGRIDYWCNIGYGRFNKRMTMTNTPRFSYNFDPKRLFLTDVNGDGLADLVYVDFGKIHLWINQSGNSWSDEIVVHGTPAVTNADSVRVVDMNGSGVVGVLWSYDYSFQNRKNYNYLDFTGGVKPLLLNYISNNIGAETKIQYRPSTYYYLSDLKQGFMWKTTLPFPLHVVALVDVYDCFSKGRLTTEYFYHHGYWDGIEREFRGFGRVDQRDSQEFNEFNSGGLHSDKPFFKIEDKKQFSPPTETRTWFHQGPVTKEYGRIYEIDFTEEFWHEDGQEFWDHDFQALFISKETRDFFYRLSDDAKRSALRTLRGKILRSELFSFDDNARKDRPYTVTEYVHNIIPVSAGDESREIDNAFDGRNCKQYIFFPCLFGMRTTQWERGSEPKTQFSFSGNYDEYGQARSQINLAVPRGQDVNRATTSDSYLITHSVIDYVNKDDNRKYIVDRVSQSRTYEIQDNHTMSVFGLRKSIELRTIEDASVKVIGQTLNYYDGPAFRGLELGRVEDYGALVRTETLRLTEEILLQAYRAHEDNNESFDEIPYFKCDSQIRWSDNYPMEFKRLLLLSPDLSTDVTRQGLKITPAGYGLSEGNNEYLRGYFVASERRKYDFHDSVDSKARGLIKVKIDARGRDTVINYDSFDLVPAETVDAAGLVTKARYDYYVVLPQLIIDSNDNCTRYSYTPLGLLESVALMGKEGGEEGDTQDQPGIFYNYNLLAFLNSPENKRQPIFIHSFKRKEHRWDKIHEENEMRSRRDQPPLNKDEIEQLFPQNEESLFGDRFIQLREYSDGFGRVLQNRMQAEDIIFGDSLFGNSVLPADQDNEFGTTHDVIGQKGESGDPPIVIVSGAQSYDNKGRVVVKTEPYYSSGFEYQSLPSQDFYGHSLKVIMYYDAMGRVVRIVNPDRSEQIVVYGVPGALQQPDLTNPMVFEPTPWENHTYDANDNAGRTHDNETQAYKSHWNTSSSTVLDALGRTVKSTVRNGLNEDSDWYNTHFTYDILGNILTITDPLKRLTFRYVYDLGNTAIYTENINAGFRRIIFDASGNEIERRDSKGALILHNYDVLNRPIRMWARDNDQLGNTVTLREKIEYGDAGKRTQSPNEREANKRLNLLGRVHQHYDEAGLISFISDPEVRRSKPYDFKGNVLEKVRQVIKDDQILDAVREVDNDIKVSSFKVDWQVQPDALLEETLYRTSVIYDALDRIKTVFYPIDTKQRRRTLHLSYNNAGALEKAELDNETYVNHIAYNAKGQRTLILYGNGIMTRYSYDKEPFLLARIRTEKYIELSPSISYRPAGSLLQDYTYEYDFVGNILAIHDHVHDNSANLSANNFRDKMFAYDPLYRLVSATGTECRYDLSEDLPPPWNTTVKCIDPNQTRLYAEEYHYDPVGNLERLVHQGVENGVHRGYTHLFNLAQNHDHLQVDHLSTMTVRNTSYSYIHDRNGNLIEEASLRHYGWDHTDQLQIFYNKSQNGRPSAVTHYFYDSAGQRVKKLIRSSANIYEVIVYIDNIFEYHKRVRPRTTLEKNVVHVMDNQSRIAIVRIGDPFPHEDAPEEPIKYQLNDHLGSTVLVLNNTGSVINWEEYYPYGGTSFGSSPKKRYRFHSRERDEETGLYYYGARYYIPWIARWASCDPYGVAGGLNPYSFTAGNPLRFKDPGGFEPIDTLIGGLAEDMRKIESSLEAIQSKLMNVNTAIERVTRQIEGISSRVLDVPEEVVRGYHLSELRGYEAQSRVLQQELVNVGKESAALQRKIAGQLSNLPGEPVPPYRGIPSPRDRLENLQGRQRFAYRRIRSMMGEIRKIVGRWKPPTGGGPPQAGGGLSSGASGELKPPSNHGSRFKNALGFLGKAGKWIGKAAGPAGVVLGVIGIATARTSEDRIQATADTTASVATVAGAVLAGASAGPVLAAGGAGYGAGRLVDEGIGWITRKTIGIDLSPSELLYRGIVGIHDPTEGYR
jgi:RHS repeat-associated protein